MSHFLRPLLRRGPVGQSLLNERTGSIVATFVELAADSKSRRRGLLGRSGLAEHHAFVLAPCNAVHTCFMRFPIDVLFVGRDGKVLKIVPQVGAWRATASFRAFAVIELAAGTLQRQELMPGDRLVIESARETTSPS